MDGAAEGFACIYGTSSNVGFVGRRNPRIKTISARLYRTSINQFDCVHDRSPGSKGRVRIRAATAVPKWPVRLVQSLVAGQADVPDLLLTQPKQFITRAN